MSLSWKDFLLFLLKRNFSFLKNGETSKWLLRNYCWIIEALFLCFIALGFSRITLPYDQWARRAHWTASLRKFVCWLLKAAEACYENEENKSNDLNEASFDFDFYIKMSWQSGICLSAQEIMRIMSWKFTFKDKLLHMLRTGRKVHNLSLFTNTKVNCCLWHLNVRSCSLISIQSCVFANEVKLLVLTKGFKQSINSK